MTFNVYAQVGPCVRRTLQHPNSFETLSYEVYSYYNARLHSYTANVLAFSGPFFRNITTSGVVHIFLYKPCRST